MRIKRIKIRKFKELPEKLREAVLEKARYWQVEDRWWDVTYEDAERIGLKITSFDDYQAQGELPDPLETIELIFKEHGHDCETYQMALRYQELFQADKVARHCIEDLDWETPDDDLRQAFKKDLLREYRKMLTEEYEYLTSDEALTEWLENSDYEFDEEGELA